MECYLSGCGIQQQIQRAAIRTKLVSAAKVRADAQCNEGAAIYWYLPPRQARQRAPAFAVGRISIPAARNSLHDLGTP